MGLGLSHVTLFLHHVCAQPEEDCTSRGRVRRGTPEASVDCQFESDGMRARGSDVTQ